MEKLSTSVSMLLITAMLAPGVGSLCAHGADYLARQPRQVDFMRPDALTLAELDLATTSNVIVARKQEAEDSATATASNAALRQPEQFYDLEPDEPDGELVDFTDSYRTYQVGDGVYTTVFGGYSGYYQDSDGTVWEVDDTLCLDGRAVTGTSDETDDDEDSIDMELINDLVKGSSWSYSTPMIRAFKASASNASSSNATSKERSVPAYENRSGAMQVSIPERMTGAEGIQIRTDRYEMEMIPLEGDFSRSAVSGNAIRFTDVFDQIDYQYTVVGGGTVKEDIILLEPTERNSFSARLKLHGQKAVQKGNQIQIKDSESNEVLFILDAPYMTDADGERSLDLQIKLSGSSGSYTVTVTADQAWLGDPDRAYPVRIDPASAIPANEFLMVTVADGMPTRHFGWEQTPMVGYVDSRYRNCRVYLAFNEQNDEYMRNIVTSATQCLEATLTVNTMTDNSRGETILRLFAPIEAWNARTLTWNTTPEVSKLENQIQTALAPNPAGAISYDIRGNQNAATNALGYTWNYQYDLVDQLTASVDPEGKATKVAYNLVGQIESVTKPGGRTTRAAYDGNYNTTAITDPKGYVYEYTYDLDNRLIQTKDPLGQTEHMTYDPGSRVTAVKDKMGLTEEYAYDPHGNVVSVTATNGLITRFQYDILDNMIRVIMPSSLTATYRYDVMGNVTQATDTMKRTTKYNYDIEGNMTSLTDASGRTETMTYDIAGRLTSYTSNGGNKISYDYDKLNDLIEKSYEDLRDPEGKEGVVYAYDALGQRVSMMDRSGESRYEYDGLGRITKVTTGSGEVTGYRYDGCDQLAAITYPDGKTVSYEYDKNDNLTRVTDRDGTVTTYEYDPINRVTEIHRPNGVSTYNTYNARDQIVTLKNICDECEWVISQYDYTYDDRGFITGEDVVESLYGYAWDDKHDGKHEHWHDELYPHGNKHPGKHDKDGEPNYQIIGTKRTFEYDDDGKLLKATEKEDRQGTYVYTFRYDDMGNRLAYSKTRNGSVQESAEYTYNASNQMIHAKLYDGKKNTTMDYEYDADGNRISETGKVGTDKVELTYIYTVENRLKAIYDADELLVAMVYDGDGNRIFQLNYNLHTDDDWKGNSGNGNGNNKDNSGSGNSGNTSGETGTGSSTGDSSNNGNSNSGNNGNGSSTGTTESSESDTTTNTSTGTANDNNGNAAGNTNNTGGSQNQSGILFPIDGEVSELESELIGMIKTTGKEKNYELIEYVNDVNREHTEVLQELNINGIMDTSYTYGNERLTNERFTGEAAYYTYNPRGSVSGLTDSEGMLHQSYRYDPFGGIDFGRPQYNNVYAYNAESYNGNTEHQYLRARYYDTNTADFLTEDSYLGKLKDPLTLNRYNYVKSNPLNYIDPSGHFDVTPWITSGEQLRDWLPNEYQITTMGSAYDDWAANYVNSTSDEEKWLLILEMQVIVKENEEKLKGVNSYNELEKLLKEADLKGQTERCMDILNELPTMAARDIGGFIIGVIDSLMSNFFVIPLYCEMVVAHIFGYDSFIEKAKRTEQILIDDYFTEYGYKVGQEFGNILSLLGAVGLWYFGATLKSGALITAKAGVATGPAAPGVAALSALAVIIGELIQIWSVTVATAAVANAMYSQFNSQNSSSSSSGSGNSSGDNKGTGKNSNEIVLDKESSHESARNTLLGARNE